MTELPTPEALAVCVNETTQAMYGLRATYVGECYNALPVATSEAPTVVVPLIGVPLYIISAHADAKGGAALASAIFSCDATDANPEMVEDSLRELCNIIASQVKSMIASDHEVGLPSRLTDADMMKEVQQWSGAKLLFGNATAAIDIAVAELPGFG